MLTPKETNALIRELKKNREDMLPRCKLKLVSKHVTLLDVLYRPCVHKLCANGEWQEGYNGDSPGFIYSLPPDFPEVPEVTEGWVVVPVDNNGFVSIDDFDLWWGEMATMVLHKYMITHFGGYIFRSQKTSLEFLSQTLVGFDGDGSISKHIKAWVKPATPVALRFWSTDVAYACTLGFKPWNADES